MAELRIRFGAECDQWGQARVLVELIDERRRIIQRFLMPLDAKTWFEVGVDKGSYLVRATLPTGELISETVHVAGDKAVEVSLIPTDMGPGDLSWAYYLAGLERCGPAAGARRRPALLTVGHMNPGEPVVGVAHSQIHPVATGQWRVRLPEHKDGSWLLVQLDERPVKAVKVPPDAQEALVVFDDSTVSNESDVNVVMPFGSPSCMALMGYLHRGQSKPAAYLGRTILADCTHSAFKPSGADAAVLAYYLLRAPQGQAKDYYGLLSQLLGGTVDGRVLAGWFRIHFPVGDKIDLEEVASHFVAAAHGEPPYFTEGMRLLMRGLDFVRQSWGEKHDQQQLSRVNHARDRLIRHAEAMDWNSILHSATAYWAYGWRQVLWRI